MSEVLPLSVEAVKGWAVAKGDEVAGVAGATLGCVVSRAAADVLGLKVLVDFRDGEGWAEFEDGSRVALPDFALNLVLWLDATDRLGRSRRRFVTGNAVAKQLERLTA